MNDAIARLNAEWRLTFYTDVMLFLTLIATLAVAIWKRRKIPELKFFKSYLVLFLILTVSSYYNISVNKKNDHTVLYESLWSQEYIVAIIEFFTFMLFSIRIATIKEHRYILYTCTCLMPIIFASSYIISFFGQSMDKYILLHYLYALEAVFFIIACTLYFIELLKLPPKVHLQQNPHFWVISGLSIYAICTLPISILCPQLIESERAQYHKMFSTIYLFYIVLFLMIIRAYLCKPKASL